MVMACCERCYIKYLKDGQPEPEFIAKTFGDNAKVEWHDNDGEFASLARMKNLPVPQECFVFFDDREEHLCTCECHEHGLEVFH